MSDDRTTPSHLVEVTQADRMAAAMVAEECNPEFEFLPEYYATGKLDSSPLCQAFARHRLSAQRSCDAEVAAWLRGEGEKHLSGIVNGEALETIAGATLKVFADAIEAGKHRNA